MAMNTVDFNLRIEHMKVHHKFDSYIETVTHFIETETDHEPEQIARYLNKKIREEIFKECNEQGKLRNITKLIPLVENDDWF